jgi:hypothetical protein
VKEAASQSVDLPLDVCTRRYFWEERRMRSQDRLEDPKRSRRSDRPSDKGARASG